MTINVFNRVISLSTGKKEMYTDSSVIDNFTHNMDAGKSFKITPTTERLRNSEQGIRSSPTPRRS